MKRKCSQCDKIRTTTNKQIPYICEPLCLRITGRNLILNWSDWLTSAKDSARKEGKAEWTAMDFGLIVFGIVIGLIIGYFM